MVLEKGNGVVKHRSIIRDGNHFIWLEESGWVLIDGPWFHHLNPDIRHQLVRVWKEPKMIAITETEYHPTTYEWDFIEWERVVWCPLYRHINPSIPLHWKHRNLIIDHRYKIGWRVLPDGRLPILYNAIEWEEDMEYWLDEIQKAYR